LPRSSPGGPTPAGTSASRSVCTSARSAASSATSNPYLRRVVEDEDLRDSVVTAFEAARDAYDRLSSNGSVIDRGFVATEEREALLAYLRKL